MTLKIADHIAWQRLNGEAVIIDIPARDAVGLNTTGLFIWERIGHHDESEIATMLADRFQVERNQAERDVASFLDTMTSRGFIKVAS